MQVIMIFHDSYHDIIKIREIYILLFTPYFYFRKFIQVKYKVEHMFQSFQGQFGLHERQQFVRRHLNSEDRHNYHI
jgi:hypothetical protein